MASNLDYSRALSNAKQPAQSRTELGSGTGQGVDLALQVLHIYNNKAVIDC